VGIVGLSVFLLGAPCRFVELGQRRQQGFEVPVVSLPFSRTVLDAHTGFREGMEKRDQLAHVAPVVVPKLPKPELSAALIPDPSSIFQYPIRPRLLAGFPMIDACTGGALRRTSAIAIRNVEMENVQGVTLHTA
jgi:hypothetical protein